MTPQEQFEADLSSAAFYEPHALVKMYQNYQKGIGTDPNPQIAFSYIWREFWNGSDYAGATLAYGYERGTSNRGINHDFAYAFYYKAALAGHETALHNLVKYHLDPRYLSECKAIPKNPVVGIEYYNKLVNREINDRNRQAIISASCIVGNYYIEEYPYRDNYYLAMEAYYYGAMAGHAESSFMIARIYNGEFKEAKILDKDECIKYLQLAIDQGHPTANQYLHKYFKYNKWTKKWTWSGNLPSSSY